MTDVERLLADYKQSYRDFGQIDPSPYLDRLQGLDRAELAAHIDRFLASNPAPAFDAAAFSHFRAHPHRQAVVARVLDDATLTDLVKASGLRRSELSRRLAQRLSLEGRETKVRRRLRDLENGDIPVDRVRFSIWETLGAIIGESGERVRRAAENVAGAAGPGHFAAYARMVPSADASGRWTEVAPDDVDEDDAVVDAAFYVE